MQVQTINYKEYDANKKFCESLKQTGFAVLSQHPIQIKLIDQVYREWEDFFKSKTKFDYQHQPGSQEGYFPFKSEHAKNYNVSDLKEFYHFYLHADNPNTLSQNSHTLFHALSKLAYELLGWIENELPPTIKATLTAPLPAMVENSETTLLRILHYPPLNDSTDPNALRAAPHEDINFITLLPAATSPGLEVLDNDGIWHQVSCNPGNIVVNVGDMLQLCTQQFFKSTTHRVVNPQGIEASYSRYSMPLFLHPREEVKLTPELSAGEFLKQRLIEIGIY